MYFQSALRCIRVYIHIHIYKYIYCGCTKCSSGRVAAHARGPSIEPPMGTWVRRGLRAAIAPSRSGPFRSHLGSRISSPGPRRGVPTRARCQTEARRRSPRRRAAHHPTRRPRSTRKGSRSRRSGIHIRRSKARMAACGKGSSSA